MIIYSKRLFFEILRAFEQHIHNSRFDEKKFNHILTYRQNIHSRQW